MTGPVVIFLGDGPWRVGLADAGGARVEAAALPEGAEPTPQTCAAAVRDRLAEAGYAGGPVVLALPSAWCLCATVSTDDLGRGGRRRALAYRLEEQLPVSAEDFTADYAAHPDGHAALGVAAETAPLAAAVRALEEAGVEVRHICPAALLAGAFAAQGRGESAGALLAARGTNGQAAPRYDLVRVWGGEPVEWWWLADDAAAAGGRLKAWAGEDEPPRGVAVVDTEAAKPATDAANGLAWEPVPDVDADGAAVRRAAALLDGTASPWIDLRRDALAAPDPYQVYHRPAGALAAALLLLLVAIAGVTFWRGRQYEAIVARREAAQAEVFGGVMDDQRVPGNPRMRLAQEAKRLAGLGGQEAGPDAAAPTSALEHLRHVLEALPRDVRFQILDLDLRPDLLRVEGRARSHTEAERVANALRQAGRYDVEPPSTAVLKGGQVRFDFTARPRGPGDGKGGGG